MRLWCMCVWCNKEKFSFLLWELSLCTTNSIADTIKRAICVYKRNAFSPLLGGSRTFFFQIYTHWHTHDEYFFQCYYGFGYSFQDQWHERCGDYTNANFLNYQIRLASITNISSKYDTHAEINLDTLSCWMLVFVQWRIRKPFICHFEIKVAKALKIQP